jgi:hypothetical protein
LAERAGLGERGEITGHGDGAAAVLRNRGDEIVEPGAVTSDEDEPIIGARREREGERVADTARSSGKDDVCHRATSNHGARIDDNAAARVGYIPRMRLRCLALAATLTLAATPHDADACGGFFPRSPGPLPSLELERVLLAWDRFTETEHFVREVTFQRAAQPFGFVVPTPSRPEVAKVDKSPFVDLDKKFPFGLDLTIGGGQGFGAGRGRLVEVLEIKRLGSFTAFVLAASDAAALKRWLDENQFQTRPTAEAWLAHYVKLGFYYVAFRYEPGGGKKGDVHAETMRISFKTPHPYYPYLEPDPDESTPPALERALAVWFVSQQRMTPIAAVRGKDGVSWKKPWREGLSPKPPPLESEVRAVVGPKLPLPRGVPMKIPLRDPDGRPQLVVQTFEDQKTSRRGFGDVVFVPEEPKDFGEEEIAKRRALLPILDPSLEASP